MIILVINCGSSSIKYQLLDMRSDDVYDLLAKGIVEKIGLDNGRLQHKPADKDKVVKDLPIPDHTMGMQLVLDALVDKDYGVLNSFEDIEAVGHRIVQGADFFSGSAIVDEDVLSKIEFFSYRIFCNFFTLTLNLNFTIKYYISSIRYRQSSFRIVIRYKNTNSFII